MGLDVNTKRGLESLKHEKHMLKYVRNKWNLEIIETDKRYSSVCDGFLVKNNVIVGLFESKCRNLSIDELEFYGSWIMTYEKIKQCTLLSKMMKVPFIGFLYLIKDDLIMYWKITDKEGKFLFDIKKEKTLTQATINGDEIVRLNGFLPVSNGNFL